MSQVLTTPSPSHEIAMPSFVCRVMDLIGAKTRDVDWRSVIAGSDDEVPICQNLIELSSDDEIREEWEENAREVMSLVCPTKVSMMQGFEWVMSQTWMVLPIPTAISPPLGEKEQQPILLAVIWNSATIVWESEF